MYRLKGVLLGPGGSDDTARTVELFVDAAGVLVDGPLPGAETLVDEGFIVPGLVDAHCHIGLGPDGPVELEEADAQARVDRDAGALLIRDCGSPVDTRPLQAREDLPEIVRAGRHIGRPKRYISGLAAELDDPALLPEAVAEQAAAGDGWVKLVGDWIDRGVGDLAPLWPDDVLVAAIEAAHAAGARVTAHVFGTDALPGLIHAGIDCIEHGTGLTDELIGEMARRGTALLITRVRGNGPRRDLGLVWAPQDLLLGLAFGLGGLFLTAIAGAVYLRLVGPEASSAVGDLFNGIRAGPAVAVAVFAIVVLLVPVCEEIVYRGLLWGAVERLGAGRWIAFGVTTVMFALAHFELTRTPLLLIIGIPIGLARAVTGRLLAGIVAHQVNNLLPGLALMLGLLGVIPLH